MNNESILTNFFSWDIEIINSSYNFENFNYYFENHNKYHELLKDVYNNFSYLDNYKNSGNINKDLFVLYHNNDTVTLTTFFLNNQSVL